MIPAETLALYDDLLQLAALPAYSGHNLNFRTKTVKGHKYHYLQLKLSSRHVEKYLGEDSPEMRDHIEQEKELWQRHQADRTHRERLVGQLRVGGMIAPSHAHAKVLAVLARAGIFHAGGVMVGTLAFQCYANMLGIDMTTRRRILGTQDIDIAESPRVNVAAGQDAQPLREAILASGLGFFEVPALDARQPSTAYQVRGQSLRVDILTPASPRNRDQDPVPMPAWNTHAKPLRHLDYLMADAQQAVVLAGAGIYVNVPAPARYALHKLFVQQQRPATENSKAQRDREQAAFLIGTLREQRPGDLYLAADAVAAQGKRFRSAVLAGLNDLQEPQLVQYIEKSPETNG